MGRTLNAIKKKLQKLRAFLWRLTTLIFQLSLFIIVVYRVVPVPVTPLQLIRVVEQFGEGRPLKLYKNWRSIENIGPKMCKAAITSEDLKFFSHYGFDHEQIWESLKRSWKKGKKLRGASTISQQTSKNIFFTPSRSWIRKGFEFYFTICIEALWTKQRILEVYLNIIEMGDGIYGSEAAARAYFNKSSRELSSAEAAIIVACFPNPRKWKPNNPTNYIKRKQSIILRYMNNSIELPWTKKEKSN